MLLPDQAAENTSVLCGLVLIWLTRSKAPRRITLESMTTKARHPALKRIAFWAVGLALSGLLVFIGMECMLRIFVSWAMTDQKDSALVQSAIPGLGYQLAANYSKGSFRTDAHGIRFRPPDSAPVRRQVLLLGDSIAYGMGVPYEKTFAPLLEEHLHRGLQETVAVWNAAVPGYNTRQEAILLGAVGPQIKPDLVIVQFCMNDHQEAPRLNAAGILDLTPAAGDEHFSLGSLLYRIRTLIFLRQKIRDLQQVRPEWFPVRLHYIHYVTKRPGWAKAQQALLQISETTRRMDARLLVVIFPVEQQLRIGDRVAQDDLVAFAKANNIQVLDLYDSFRSRWRDHLYVDYWEREKIVDKLHLSERGHALAAAEIGRVILERPDLYLLHDQPRPTAPSAVRVQSGPVTQARGER